MADTPLEDASDQSGDGTDRIRQARLDKLERLENAGVRGYPTTFPRTHRAQEIHANFDTLEGQRVCVSGRVDVETRYRQRYLDLMANPETRQVFLTRSRVIGAIRRYLDARGFVEIETPVLQPIAGGGSARPFATESYAMDSRMYLRIALELYLKRAIIGGIERVYEIGRNFRNEGVSYKHSPEFTMLELYQAYADYEDIMRLTEELVSAAARAAVGKTRVQWGDQEIDFSPPWQRVSLRTAIAEFSGVDYADYT